MQNEEFNKNLHYGKYSVLVYSMIQISQNGGKR